MVLDVVDKRKGGETPVLVVLPDATSSVTCKAGQLLVRSFKDNKL